MWKMLVGLVGAGIVAFFQPVIGAVLLAVVALAALVSPPAITFAGLPGRIGLASSLLAAGATGWIGTALFWGLVGPRTPAPPAAVTASLMVDSARLAVLSSSDRAAVIAYAGSLEFADSAEMGHPPDRYHGQWDRNLMDTLGTLGLLQPEKNIHRSWKRDLRWGAGRVQLKITIVPSSNHPGTIVSDGGISLFPGVTYVWVDSLVMTSHDSGTARALYIPGDSTLPVQRRLLHVLRGKAWNQAVARWTPAQCWDCVRYDWCH
jgi:hypothetical protein